MLLASVATTQLSVFAFESYTSQCFIGEIFNNQVMNLTFFGYVYQERIFPIAMLSVLLLYGIYALVSGMLRNRK
jgi:hypothetical protein